MSNKTIRNSVITALEKGDISDLSAVYDVDRMNDNQNTDVQIAQIWRKIDEILDKIDEIEEIRQVLSVIKNLDEGELAQLRESLAAADIFRDFAHSRIVFEGVN